MLLHWTTVCDEDISHHLINVNSLWIHCESSICNALIGRIYLNWNASFKVFKNISNKYSTGECASKSNNFISKYLWIFKKLAILRIIGLKQTSKIKCVFCRVHGNDFLTFFFLWFYATTCTNEFHYDFTNKILIDFTSFFFFIENSQDEKMWN